MQITKIYKCLRIYLFFFFLLQSVIVLIAQETKEKNYQEFTVEVMGEGLQFFKDGSFPGQKNTFVSFTFKPSYYLEWKGGKHRLQITPFIRLDRSDSKRSHYDLRELYWQTVQNKYELNIGVRKVFWGTTEAVHLVDIINQTDILEGFGGFEKLGQPMFNLVLPTKKGAFSLFYLPYFRRRHFFGIAGRFRTSSIIARKGLAFESPLRVWHPNVSARWSQTINQIDIGLAHFYGTDREPFFVATEDPINSQLLYPIIHQTSIDIQAPWKSFLWKAEAIYRTSTFQSFYAFAGGFEYTFRNIKSSGVDLGILGEYLYDGRGIKAPNPFDNDLFIGARIALNDPQSTTFLFSGIFDLKQNNAAHIWNMKATRRFGNSWKLEVELRFFREIAEQEILFFFQKDNYGQLRLYKYF